MVVDLFSTDETTDLFDNFKKIAKRKDELPKREPDEISTLFKMIDILQEQIKALAEDNKELKAELRRRDEMRSKPVKWEYMSEVCAANKEKLAKLGLQGWEAVAGTGSYNDLVLKREIKEPSHTR